MKIPLLLRLPLVALVGAAPALACGSSPSSAAGSDAGSDGPTTVPLDGGGHDAPTSATDSSAPADSGAEGASQHGNDAGSEAGNDAGAGPANAFYIYQNDDGTGTSGLNAAWDYELSFGSGKIDYKDTTHPEPGHAYDLYNHLMGWQPAAVSQHGSNPNASPYGLDISAYTFMVLDLWTDYPADQFDLHWEYIGGAGNNDIQASAYVDNITTVPGVALTAGAWNTQIKIPLAFAGQLGMKAVYKFYLRANAGHDFYLDNVGLIPGGYSWIYDGGTPSAWNNSSSSWDHDPAGLMNGWSDASVGATANYAFDPGSLTQTQLYGQNALSGLQDPGLAASSAKVIQLSVTSSGGMWKVSHAGGFDLSPYTYLTFGVLPTSSTRSFHVQLYDASGQAIGAGLDPTPYTNHDWGPSARNWTVYSIPLSAFGSPSSIGGLSVKDNSGLSSNTLYLSAPGFFR
jgi:hypothetical protein